MDKSYAVHTQNVPWDIVGYVMAVNAKEAFALARKHFKFIRFPVVSNDEDTETNRALAKTEMSAVYKYKKQK